MKRWLVPIGLLILGFSLSAVQRGETPPKGQIRITTGTAAPLPGGRPAWQFTDQERVALRTNPALARERVAERRERGGGGKPHATSLDEQQLADSLDGRTHPELFLPFEVFRHFVDLAFAEDARLRDIVRHGMDVDVKNAGLPPDFWERLERVVAFHVADVRAESDLLASRSKVSGAARERVEKTLELKHFDVCRSRADALAGARTAFGRDRFDRFLYGAVAIHMFQITDRLPTAEELRRWEGGCR